MPDYNGQNRRRVERRSQYDRRRRDRRAQPSVEQAVVEAVLGGLWAVIKFPFKRGRGKQGKPLIPPAIATQLAGHWPSIDAHAENASTRSLAVSEADKLLDAALQAAGIPGTTMGERLQASEGKFSKGIYQQIWQAHKLRNTIAHEIGIVVAERDAFHAVDTFKNALRELGVPV